MPKIVTKSMREQIYDALRSLILSNEYSPKTVLAIDRLAEEFGVSATPVREALVRLEADGLVELVPNKGAQVTDIREADVRHIWEMRLLLEPYAARQSLLLLKKSTVDALENDIRKLQANPSDEDLYASTDMRLHEMLYENSSNPMLIDSIRRVHSMAMRIRFFAEHSSAMHERVVHDVIDEHLAIVSALRGGSPDAVEDLLRVHLRHGMERTMAALAG